MNKPVLCVCVCKGEGAAEGTSTRGWSLVQRAHPRWKGRPAAQRSRWCSFLELVFPPLSPPPADI